jgi:hypothetical protein
VGARVIELWLLNLRNGLNLRANLCLKIDMFEFKKGKAFGSSALSEHFESLTV